MKTAIILGLVLGLALLYLAVPALALIELWAAARKKRGGSRE